MQPSYERIPYSRLIDDDTLYQMKEICAGELVRVSRRVTFSLTTSSFFEIRLDGLVGWLVGEFMAYQPL